MAVIWYLDRAAGLLAYAALYVAVLSGIFYDARGFGWLREAARRLHVEVSVFTLLLTGLHGVLGTLDTWAIAVGDAPAPAYGQPYLLVGVVVGLGTVLTLVVAVLGFVDARRFDRPWSPTVVHAFAYAAFAFATIHAAAIGTDLLGLVRPLLVGAGTFLVYTLMLRTLARGGSGLFDGSADAGQ
jgi:hypothetical protein